MEGVRPCLFSFWLLGLVASASLANGHTCAQSARALRSEAQPFDEAETEDARTGLPCGKTIHLAKRAKTLRILNSDPGRAGELPFLASFENRSCAATIIDEHHLLTSASCAKSADKNNFTVYIGCHGKEDCKAKRVSNYIAHEKYDALDETRRDAFNIALLKSETPMYFHLTSNGIGSVNRICLPNENDGYKAGDRLTIAGWGDHVNWEGKERQFWPEMANDMRFMSIDRCAQFMERPGKSVYYPDIHLCVVDALKHGEVNWRHACDLGDMGGPLLGLKSGSYEIVGVRSSGRIGCGRWTDFLSIYIRVSAFLEWIEWAKKEMARTQMGEPTE